jgi:Hemerythrin HHE cation binding domain
MPHLVETLTAQHQQVVRIATQINEAISPAGDVKRLRSLLDTLTVGLLAHLALEDKSLYPALIAAAETAGDATQLALVRSFSENMQRISTGLQSFLQRHSSPTVDLALFRKEWKDILGVLTQRIQSEERVLYPLHARLTAAAQASRESKIGLGE